MRRCGLNQGKLGKVQTMNTICLSSSMFLSSPFDKFQKKTKYRNIFRNYSARNQIRRNNYKTSAELILAENFMK